MFSNLQVQDILDVILRPLSQYSTDAVFRVSLLMRGEDAVCQRLLRV